jgi:diaminopimelate decarboxylase
LKRCIEAADWGVDKLISVAGVNGTPLYVYDLDRLRCRIDELHFAFSNVPCHLYFATMANDQPEFLRALSGKHIGACVNSIPHLKLAIEAGFSPSKIQFTSTGISIADMRMLSDMGITVNLDSLQQVKTWFETGATSGGLRINAGSLGALGMADRIGMDVSEVGAGISLAREFGRRIDGLHIYVGTNFPTHHEMIPVLSAFFEFAAKIEGLRYLNLGGGIGINYTHSGADFDVAKFGEVVAGFAQTLNSKRADPVDIILEPGRGIAATCGIFVTTVTDVKILNKTRYVTVDGSVAVFPRPFHSPDTPHFIRLLRSGHEQLQVASAVIVGRTTFSRDILGVANLPDDLCPGDILAIYDAGAYSQSMMSRFLGQSNPGTVFFDDQATKPGKENVSGCESDCSKSLIH